MENGLGLVASGLAAPKPNLAAQLKGIPVPCNDDNTVHNGPVNLQISFWVQGVAAGSETQAYRAVVQAFGDAGWSTVPDKGYPDEVTCAYTSDGYAIVAQLNPEGGQLEVVVVPGWKVAAQSGEEAGPVLVLGLRERSPRGPCSTTKTGAAQRACTANPRWFTSDESSCRARASQPHGAS